MKKLLLLTAVLTASLTFAQVPQGISYQAIALNTSGTPVVNGNVSLRLSILDNTASGTAVYTETHTKTTNAQGLFNLVIGQGTAVNGTFAGVNWKTNSKFLKVEMDVAGGSNFVTVGTTQLLSVPYALAAKSFVGGPGEGITLTSPNGTPYQLTVGNDGQLSVPAASAGSASVFSSLYMYGSFNSFDAFGALQMGVMNTNGESRVYGYKYLTAGTQLKFVTANNATGSVYGVNTSGELQLNSGAYTINTTGFYFISAYLSTSDMTKYALDVTSISPKVYTENSLDNGNYIFNPVYNAAANTFTYTLNGVTTGNAFRFLYNGPEVNAGYYGDNLTDGTVEANGDLIPFPNATSTPKNYKVVLTLNFNGQASYTVTQI